MSADGHITAAIAGAGGESDKIVRGDSAKDLETPATETGAVVVTIQPGDALEFLIVGIATLETNPKESVTVLPQTISPFETA